MKMIERNIDRLEQKNKDLYNLLSCQSYGARGVVVEGERETVAFDFVEDFDELFNFGELMRFFEHGLAKGKSNEWIMVEGQEVVEFGFSDIGMIQAKYPNMLLGASKKIYKVLMNFKKDYDNRYQVIEYKLDLTNAGIHKVHDKVTIKQKLIMKDIVESHARVYRGLSTHQINDIESIVKETLAGYTGIVIKGALYRKFLGNLKKALWHFVDEKDSGKTFWLENIEACVDIYQEDKLSKIFGEKAKVDAASLNKSLILHQDEATVMFNDFKLLTNSTLKLDLAYAKKQIRVDAPLVIMTSHDDAQSVYSEQFQARVVKIYPKTGSVIERIDVLEKLGYTESEISAVTYMYIRTEIENAIEMARSKPGIVRGEVLDFVKENEIRKHDPINFVRGELYNMLTSLIAESDTFGSIDRKYSDWEFELGESLVGARNGFAVKKRLLVVTGVTRMRDKFLKHLILDKTIFYEINESKYESIGFEFKAGVRFNTQHGQLSKQKAYVLDIDDFLAGFEAEFKSLHGVDIDAEFTSANIDVFKADTDTIEADALRSLNPNTNINMPSLPGVPDLG